MQLYKRIEKYRMKKDENMKEKINKPRSKRKSLRLRKKSCKINYNSLQCLRSRRLNLLSCRTKEFSKWFEIEFCRNNKIGTKKWWYGSIKNQLTGRIRWKRINWEINTGHKSKREMTGLNSNESIMFTLNDWKQMKECKIPWIEMNRRLLCAKLWEIRRNKKDKKQLREQSKNKNWKEHCSWKESMMTMIDAPKWKRRDRIAGTSENKWEWKQSFRRGK